MTDRPPTARVARGESVEVAHPADRADAFRRLAEGHLDKGYRLARAILGEPADAEDAVHDAYILAWRQWSTLRDPSRFERWFDRILINTCRNRLRRRGRLRIEDISTELQLAEPGDRYSDANDREEVGRALAHLDPDHRIVVALRFFADLTVDDIAARVGVPAGTVKSRLHVALRRLHAALGLPGEPEVSS